VLQNFLGNFRFIHYFMHGYQTIVTTNLNSCLMPNQPSHSYLFIAWLLHY